MTRSFRNLLTLILVALAMIPVLVLTYPFTALVSQLTERNAARETTLIAEGIARDLQSDLKTLITQAQALSRDSDVQRGTRSILFAEKAQFLIKRFTEENSLAGATYLLNDNFRTSSAQDNEPIFELLKNSFNGEIPDDKGFYKFFVKDDSFLLSVPVHGPLDRPTGLLVIELPNRKLRDLVASRVSGPVIAQLIVDEKSEQPPLASKLDFRHEAPLLISGSAFENTFNARVLVREPKSIRLGAVRKTVRLMLMSSVLFALLAGAAGYYLALRLNRPFRRLNEHLQKYETGDYGAKAPEFGIQEFKLIAGTLDSMAGKIHSQIQLAAETERIRGEVARTRLETELHSLHQQMQPHFLFNTLNNIGTMIHIDANRAVRLVNKFSDLYRLILEMSRTNTVPLEKELEVVSNYLELQQMRFGDRLRYSVEVNPDLKNLHVPGLMLQTLVENSVKHGIAKSREGGEIRVRITATDASRYLCEIVNTGNPLRSQPEQSSGTGLPNTHRRLALLYGENHCFRLYSNDQGQTVASFYFSGVPV